MADTRTYRSELRRQRAGLTRSAILGAARRLFADRSYEATSVADIARAAGVSVPTLYASVGTKAQIALALVPFINDEVGMLDLRAARDAAESPAELIRADVHLNRVLNEKCGDILLALIGGARREPELVPAVTAGRHLHRTGQQIVAAGLVAGGGLRAGLSEADALIALTLMTLPETFAQLVGVEGLSYQQAEEWLAAALQRQLLRR
ncbi:MAG TPA: helix-turn-helix domain-containing protein [Nakamurella sp.]|nr:helix-turn-helix domain-containing protein [Nakamurella sp.]